MNSVLHLASLQLGFSDIPPWCLLLHENGASHGAASRWPFDLFWLAFGLVSSPSLGSGPSSSNATPALRDAGHGDGTPKHIPFDGSLHFCDRHKPKYSSLRLAPTWWILNAARDDCVLCVRVGVEKLGVDVRAISDSFGKTAYNFAEEKDATAVMEYLRSIGGAS